MGPNYDDKHGLHMGSKMLSGGLHVSQFKITWTSRCTHAHIRVTRLTPHRDWNSNTEKKYACDKFYMVYSVSSAATKKQT
jgi:hypothetical protein